MYKDRSDIWLVCSINIPDCCPSAPFSAPLNSSSYSSPRSPRISNSETCSRFLPASRFPASPCNCYPSYSRYSTSSSTCSHAWALLLTPRSSWKPARCLSSTLRTHQYKGTDFHLRSTILGCWWRWVLFCVERSWLITCRWLSLFRWLNLCLWLRPWIFSCRPIPTCSWLVSWTTSSSGWPKCFQ